MNPSRRFVTLVLFTTMASVGIYTVSCSSDDPKSDDGGELGGVVYLGGTTDEALEEMLAEDPHDWAWKAGVFDTPTEGAILPASPPATFAWHQDVQHPEDGGTDAFLRKPIRRGSPFDGLIGPEKRAFAHGAPFNGTGFFLVFSTDANPKVLRVFTGLTTFAPDEAAWAKLVATKGATIKLEISSAIFENNLLASEGGPYDGSSITFKIQE